MRVAVALDHRFARTPDGAVWTRTFFAHQFWLRYARAFDRVLVVARVRDVLQSPADGQRVDGESVSVCGLPHYIGPAGYLRQRRAIRRALHAAIEPDDAVILRVSSQVATAAAAAWLPPGRPYGVEVVANPFDVFAPGGVRHPLRRWLRWWFPLQLRRQCARASAAAYVTERALQRQYPSGPAAYSTHYSSVELPSAAFVATPRAERPRPDTLRLIAVGTLEEPYKGPDVLLDSTALLARAGMRIHVTWVGDGRRRPEFERRAAALGIAGLVRFRGSVPGGELVRDELDRADLFVLPSRQEGLPRAMVEAMARALPCVGTTIGGIPELLPPEDLVPSDDPAALAAKLRQVLDNPRRLAAMSARNLLKAREYRDEVLEQRRTTFYRMLRQQTERWLSDQPAVDHAVLAASFRAGQQR